MQFEFSFSVLLVGVLVAISTQNAQALPLAKHSAGMVTLSLNAVKRSGADIHPQILFQQHMNRGQRRLARMTGRAEPSVEELRDNLHKRALSIEGRDALSKRYNRAGTKWKGAKYEKSHKHKGKGAAADDAVEAPAAEASAGAAEGAGCKDAGKGAAADGTAATPSVEASSVASGNAAVGAGADSKAPVTAANQPAIANSLGLDIEANDVGYLATVQIGTPPRDFLILMDSGSADFWVGAENCQSEAGGGCGTHQFLGTKGSSSFKDTAKTWNVTYGTGQVDGTIANDNLHVAGLVLDAHTFGVASAESVQFSADSVPFDGLMGLAQSKLSRQETLTPVEAMVKNGLIKEAITSYKIPRFKDNKNDGEITFGGLDPTKFDANTLTTLPNIDEKGFWQAALPAVTVDGTDTGLEGRTAILDTGTTVIIAPPADVIAVHQKIEGAKSDGQGGFTVPCNTKASVSLTFGKTQFAIDPRDLAFQPLDPNDPNGDCASGISSGNVGGATEWLVGDVFLKSAYFSTDVGKNQISLAKLV